MTFLTDLHNKAIELKFKGYTYSQISKQLDGKISEGVLKNHFSLNGLLYEAYLDFITRRNEIIDQEVRAEYKRMAGYSVKIIKALLQNALKEHNWRLAFDIQKDILDRAGITAYEKTRIETRQEAPTRFMTREDLNAELIRQGIDPATGLRISRPLEGTA